MSHAVVRGKPTKSQLYLDKILDEVLVEQGIEPTTSQRQQVTVTKVILHCLKKNPDRLLMTNGATGEELTSSELLSRAILIARALTVHGAKGKTAICLMKNQQWSVAVYFGTMFSGVLPFMMDLIFTEYELTHFMKLIEPSFMFYDEEYHDIITKVLHKLNMSPLLVKTDVKQPIEEFVQGQSGEWKCYQVEPASIEDPVILLPTSGSTGIPKAAVLTHKGLVAQLPSLWYYHTEFPTPTPKMLITTPMQWITCTVSLTSCVVYDVPIVMSPKANTPENITELLEKYQPSCWFTSPSFAATLVHYIQPDQWSSLEQLILIGAPIPTALISALKNKLPSNAKLSDCYGCTEIHGVIALPDNECPDLNSGRVLNNMEYKIVDDNGHRLGTNSTGEMLLKGVTLVKGYYNNEKAWLDSCTPDGWYKSGDVFYVSEDERISFRMRKKFNFKFMGCQVAPEEIENIINSIPGVEKNVVIATDNGPTAAVVLQPNADVTKERIKQTVDTYLSEHKRLHGGVWFVSSLPHTTTGKLLRRDCDKLIMELLKNGQ